MPLPRYQARRQALGVCARDAQPRTHRLDNVLPSSDPAGRQPLQLPPVVADQTRTVVAEAQILAVARLTHPCAIPVGADVSKLCGVYPQVERQPSAQQRVLQIRWYTSPLH